MRRLLPLALLLLAAAPPRETRDLPANAASPPARIADLTWLIGRWTGKGIGGQPAEEIYFPAAGGQIAGHFVQLKDGGVMFYEIIQIAPAGDSLVYRLKHFNADLTGWEEKNEVESFRLVAVERDAVHFDGLSLYRKGADGLRAVVLVKQDDGTTGELGFDYRRAK